ncbi:MAG: NYN domain-containing protein [Deltaproteobacteria bacterium]|nr:NYN domain-containing protein [Deltaproteobacteria bacterium]MBW2153486.1 NYN domain-containing protein [Deltaproteobacteria bacterium]
MAIHIIIDGYNLIHQCHMIAQDVEAARETLLDALAAYKRTKGHRITVIFDGAGAPVTTQQRDRRKGIDITFSRDELADTVIKRMAAREGQKALVVSSDTDIVRYAASKGAATISSVLFAQKIAAVFDEGREELSPENDVGWVPTTRKKGPRRRLPKRERRNRTKIKKL